PVETSPMIFLPLFDLDIRDAERCSAAQALVISALRGAADEIAAADPAGAELLELPPVEIAQVDGVPCRQANDRSFSAPALAASALQAIDKAFGADRRVRALVAYANNIDLPLPESLL